jgi:hypothetical protein
MPVATAPIAVTTNQIVRRVVEDANHPSRLNRRVVRDLDAVIAACEQLHLIGRERMTSALFGPTAGQMTVTVALARADAFLAAHGVVSPTPDPPISARSKITTVLDALFAMQEVVFDVLIPERSWAYDDDTNSLHKASGEWM